MGETAIDEDTFNEYLEEIRQHYTADKVSIASRNYLSSYHKESNIHHPPLCQQYHLLGPYFSMFIRVLELYLNRLQLQSFTNDCIGFLTGGSIPDYIKGTPPPPLTVQSPAHGFNRTSNRFPFHPIRRSPSSYHRRDVPTSFPRHANASSSFPVHRHSEPATSRIHLAIYCLPSPSPSPSPSPTRNSDSRRSDARHNQPRIFHLLPAQTPRSRGILHK